ncbi:MAG: N-acetylmuramoyl-L-alanine amidase [Nitrospirae bacterium]|nr:N-acetylmuramoyl-L-alanine amidase [Nitrospirota bacterium]
MKKALVMPLLFLFLISYSEASKDVTIQKLRFSSHKDHTRIVVDVDGPIKFTSNSLSKPDRLYFDLTDCTLPKKLKSSFSLNDGIIDAVRTSQFKPGTVRIVIDLQKLKSFYAFTMEDPHKLVIDVYAEEAHLPEKKDAAKKEFIGIKKIVIDPGHGGQDPGAIGPGGLREKDIVLDVGRELGKILKEEYHMDVIFTREKDVFVPLNERTDIANQQKADFFISIHANASPRRAARGIETYFLGSNNDDGSLRVAARENNISIDKMRRLRGDLQMILADLRRSYKIEESGIFARNVQDSMVSTLRKNYSGIENLDVKQALFYVLIGAEMPSILVETSFISNHEEEKRLSNPGYRKKIAESIARGVSAYIRRSGFIAAPVEEFEMDILSEELKTEGNNLQQQS